MLKLDRFDQPGRRDLKATRLKRGVIFRPADIDEQARFAGVMDLARQLPAQVLINLFSNGVTLVLSFAFFGGDVGYVR